MLRHAFWCLLIIPFVLAILGCGAEDAPTGLAGLASPSAGEQPAEPTLMPASPSPVASANMSATLAPASPNETSTATTQPTSTSTSTATASPTPSPTTLPTDTPTPIPTTLATKTPKSPHTAVPTSRPAPTFAPAAGDPAAIRLDLNLVVGGLDRPVAVAGAGDGSGRLFVVEKKGFIRVVQNHALADAPFLDITDRVGSSSSEQGLLGLAFHPDYAGNGLFFVNYTDLQGDTVVARFAASGDQNRAQAGSEAVILTLDQPAANHNGGHLAFGQDGYLYVGTGDGGGAGDQYANGQNGQTLLGAMLRLDVDGGAPYTVPGTNPFVGRPDVRDDIWALGLRNPWRYSFDRLTGDLFIADVGQNQYEEVNFQPAESAGGQNYGWPIMEGRHCYPADRPCERAGLMLPVREYDHSRGCSVTGGYVYPGQEFPILTGIYLFGDYCSGRIWGLAPAGNGDWQVAELAQVDAQLSSFGEDERGELYLLDMGRGEIFKITALLR